MVVSFILINSGNNNKLLTTVNSIVNQSQQGYEIIIIDSKINAVNSDFYSKHFNNFIEVIKVITSWNEIDTATSWNLAVANAKGEYVLFLQPGYEIVTNFIALITKEIKNNKQPDLLEFRGQYFNVYNHTSSSRLKNDFLYDPILNREIFALIHHSLFNKLFKRKIIINNKINFRPTKRFDLLFIYQLLPLIKTFYTSSQILVKIEIEPTLNFSSFDFIKQWIHIFNYYKKINLAKELTEELEYAFVRFHYYTFLKIVKPTNNDILINKALREVQNKVAKKFPNWEVNSYLKLKFDDQFKELWNKKELINHLKDGK